MKQEKKIYYRRSNQIGVHKESPDSQISSKEASLNATHTKPLRTEKGDTRTTMNEHTIIQC